jgi:DNA polymerase III delta subunit
MPKVFTVVYGDEEFLLDKARDHFRANDKMAVLTMDCEGKTGKAVVEMVDGAYLGDQPRLFVLDNANAIKSPAPLQRYIDSLDTEQATHKIAVIVRSDNLSAMWETAVLKGVRKLYAKPAPWKTSEQVTILRGEIARLGLQVDNRLLESLIQQVGWELGIFVREFEKLAVLLGPGGLVTQEVLAKVTSLQKQAEPWSVSDALAARQRSRAMNLLSACYKANGDQCLVPVVVTAMRQFEKLAVVKALQAKGASEEAIAARVGMHPFRCKQTLIPNAARYSKQEILGALQILCRLDILVKGSALSKRTHVELALLKIAS